MNKHLFQHHYLDEKTSFWTGKLPETQHFSIKDFLTLWEMHPEEYHLINIGGVTAKTPRWQQAYGKDYQYTGNLNKAFPIPAVLESVTTWCQDNIDKRLNGILVNWYDGSKGHYIGKHRDSTINIIPGAPIVTISLGEERLFRMRPWRGQGFKDFLAKQHSVFIIPYGTNENWTHEVPASSKYQEKRISITLRGFEK